VSQSPVKDQGPFFRQACSQAELPLLGPESMRLKPHLLVTLLLILALLGLLLHGGVPTKSAPPAGLIRVQPERERREGERGATWELPEVGLRLAIPPGWSETEVKDRRYLRRTCDAPLEGNLNLIQVPNWFRRDLDGLLTENIEELTENTSFTLESARKLRVDGRDVLRIDYRGTPRGATEELHFSGLIFLRGSTQVVITACARAAVWGEVEPWVESSFASLEFADAN
jgi:hypothetical protein